MKYLLIIFCLALVSCENKTLKEYEKRGQDLGFESTSFVLDGEWFALVEDKKTKSRYLFKYNSGAVKLD